MTKEQEESIEILENLKTVIETGLVNFSGKSMYDCGYQEAIEHILSDLKNVLSMLEEKEKIIGLYIDNIMTHQQVKTIRKMCCPSCPIGEKACTYSGIHRNCIKQYFENKAKELLNK